MTNNIANKKAMTILLKVGMMKKIWLYKMSYLHTHSKSKIEISFKKRAGVDTSKFAKRTDHVIILSHYH